MKITHRITGYDKQTESLKIAYVIPVEKSENIKMLANVAAHDPNAIGIYPFENLNTCRVEQEIGKQIDTDLYDWFLEPFYELK